MSQKRTDLVIPTDKDALLAEAAGRALAASETPHGPLHVQINAAGGGRRDDGARSAARDYTHLGGRP